MAACREGVRTKVFTAAALVNQLEEAQKKFGLDQLLKRLDKIDLLIVDDLGYLSFSRSGAELLFQIFADRYERCSSTSIRRLVSPRSTIDSGTKLSVDDLPGRDAATPSDLSFLRQT